MNALANFVTKHAKKIVGFWVLFFCVAVFFAIQLPSKLEGDGFFVDADHVKVTDELSRTFGLPAKTIFVLFNNKSESEIKSALLDLSSLKDIQEIQSPLDDPTLQRDDISYAMLHFSDEVKDYLVIVNKIRTILGRNKGIEITGEPVISNDINKASQKDLAQAETIGLPIALIVLLLAFGTIVASLLPIIIGVVTVVMTFGILTLLGDTVNLSIFIFNIVPMLGLALSIDFALLLINRYREERINNTIEESVQIAIQTAGRSIIFSAACVMIGLGAMVVIRVEIFENIALGGSIVVLLALLTGLTLLPASIVLIGDYLNKWRIIRVSSGGSLFWKGFAGFVMKRPVSIVVVALLLLGIGMIPLKDIQLTIPGVDSLPQSYEARHAYEKLQDQFGLGYESALYLLAERKNGWNDESGYSIMLDIQKQLLADPLVKEVSTIFTVSQLDSVNALTDILTVQGGAAQLQPILETFIQDKQMFIPIILNANGSSSEAQQFARLWSDKDLGVEFALGGHGKFNQEVFEDFPKNLNSRLYYYRIYIFHFNGSLPFDINTN